MTPGRPKIEIVLNIGKGEMSVSYHTREKLGTNNEQATISLNWLKMEAFSHISRAKHCAEQSLLESRDKIINSQKQKIINCFWNFHSFAKKKPFHRLSL